MKYLSLILSVCMILSACAGDDDELTLERMEYTGNELRLDGYYYNETLNFEGVIVSSYFLYSNGIIHYAGTQAEEKFWSTDYQQSLSIKSESAMNNKYHWGVFKIFDNEIEFERWYPSDPPLEVFVRSGTILNDTTFRITKSFKPDGSDQVERDELYKFKQFSPKPDSTNTFID
jgi:hypothetical protein